LLINLAVDNLSALAALPVTSPLSFAVADKLIPVIKLLLKPVIELEGLIVKLLDVHIAITMSSASNNITG
jgi:hypothetical protein